MDRTRADTLAEARLQEYTRAEGLNREQFDKPEVLDQVGKWLYTYEYRGSPKQSVALTVFADGHVEVSRMLQPPQLVTIESLDGHYSSCGIVNFLVRNTSRQDLYVEVYVEDLKQGVWEEAWCQYNLNDPAGRLVKRVWQNPKMMKPGEALAVRYDRCTDYEICVRPKFPKNDKRGSRQGLQEQDAHAPAPVTQRIRVEVFARIGGSLKEAGRVWSTPFTRKPAT